MSHAISIVIPTISNTSSLGDCLKSIAADNFSGQVKIVVQQAINSTHYDFCFRVAKQFPNLDIEVVLNPIFPATMADNWTYAIEIVETPFVRLLCDDDLVSPGSNVLLLNELSQYENASFVCGRRQLISADGRNLRLKVGLKQKLNQVDYSKSLRLCAIHGTTIFGEPSAILWRTNHLKREMPWSLKYPYVIDLEMCLRVLRNRESVAITLREVVANFRIHSNSLSAQLAKKQAKQFNSFIMSELSGKNLLMIFSRFSASMRAFLRRLTYLLLKLLETHNRRKSS